ncbi:DUF6281 family protein [Nocardioides exalbidus]|uniref:DUF6281 family protein n=1 Tax=Nocardioides exalbidus TaxID=402596 RepID=UPI000B8679D4|nr:DUF6281 family protein [Nocardioides exalbidus]
MLCLVLAASTAGCSDTGSTGSADCSAQIRESGVVYTSYGTTRRDATRHVEADVAQCDDIGPDAGSVFPDDPGQVRTWVFDGYSPSDVLGVQYGRTVFGVFVADRLHPDVRERIYRELSDAEP